MFYLAAGFNVAMINYTGSSCYGEDSCTVLLGKVGMLDVMDCEDTIKASLRTHPENNPENGLPHRWEPRRVPHVAPHLQD